MTGRHSTIPCPPPVAENLAAVDWHLRRISDRARPTSELVGNRARQILRSGEESIVVAVELAIASIREELSGPQVSQIREVAVSELWVLNSAGGTDAA